MYESSRSSWTLFLDIDPDAAFSVTRDDGVRV